MDILCTDKTGTLTQNKVVLIKHVDVDGNDAMLPLTLVFLNSHFQTGLKNLLDEALLLTIMKMKLMMMLNLMLLKGTMEMMAVVLIEEVAI